MTDQPEKESVTTPAEAPGVRAPVPENEGLSKEVTSAGVSIHPTTIPIPPPVGAMGVKPGVANIPMPTASTVLPLSDDQIAQGLRKSIRDSWRWLAQWCLRRLKQVHIGLQSVHGKLTRREIK